jgi:hypothetical protein
MIAWCVGLVRPGAICLLTAAWLAFNASVVVAGACASDNSSCNDGGLSDGETAAIVLSSVAASMSASSLAVAAVSGVFAGGRVFTGTGAAMARDNPDAFVPMEFAFSLRQIITAEQDNKENRRNGLRRFMLLGATLPNTTALPLSGFDIWAKGSWSEFSAATIAGRSGLLSVGVEYRIASDLVVGFSGLSDSTNAKDDTDNSKVDRKGWMAGPYMAARLHPKLIFEAGAAWGQSNGEISSLETTTNSFDSERWLVRGQFVGDLKFGAIRFAPHVGVIYFEEKQQTKSDTLNIEIGDQTTSLGRFTFGPKVSTRYRLENGTMIAPFVAVTGGWDFKRADFVDVATGLAASGNDKLRGTVEAGISVRLRDGVSLTSKGFYDGIGVSSYSAYGASVALRAAF